jgi:YYY domain-containing protein
MQYGLVALWLATYLVLALAALPIAAALFPRFADRGAAFALPIALATLGVVGYLVGHLAFGWVALGAGLVVLLGVSYLVSERSEVDYRAFGEVALVFSLAFLFMVYIRAHDPTIDPGAGEKFLDFGLLNSLIRADVLAPEDPWFAGEPVKYYYGGHLVAALLTRLTSTVPAYAYNLVLVGFFATFVTAAYGLAGNVAAALSANRRLAAGMAAFFVGVGANLRTPAQVALWLLPDGLASSVASALALTPETVAWTPAQFSYWTASRVIPGTVNEFPLFAWLNGDLHAHMMSPPFLLLVAALAFSYWQTPAADLGRRRLLVFGAIPPVAGFVALVNTWSFPTTLGVTWLTLTFAPANPLTLLPQSLTERLPTASRADGGAPSHLGRELSRTGTALVIVVGLAALAVVWTLPFWFGTASGRSIALFPTRSSLGGLVLVHGAFLFAFIPYLWQRARGTTDQPRFLLGGVVFAGIIAWVSGFAAVALFVPLLVAAWGLLRLRRDVGFETVLILGGLGLALLVEFVYIVEDAGPERFNTVFKVYSQVWALWAPAVGVVLARLAIPEDVSVSLPNPETARAAARVLAVVLVFSTSLYAAFAIPAHLTGEPTLDGMAYVEQYHGDEAEAITWLNSLDGQPNMVSAPACWCNGDTNVRPYAWANAPASLTGIPTVVGWQHEVGYRGEEAFRERYADVGTIFEGPPDEQRRLLAKYDVEYIYVGPNERAVYGQITVTDLDAVHPAGQFGSVTIYRVNQDALSVTHD